MSKIMKTIRSIKVSYNFRNFCFNFFVFCFLGLHPRHKEVPRLGVESELQLQACTTATAMWDPRHICDLHHSSQQCQIFNLPSEARDQTHIPVDTSHFHYHWVTIGIPFFGVILSFFFFFFLRILRNSNSHSLIPKIKICLDFGITQLRHKPPHHLVA